MKNKTNPFFGDFVYKLILKLEFQFISLIFWQQDLHYSTDNFACLDKKLNGKIQ